MKKMPPRAFLTLPAVCLSAFLCALNNQSFVSAGGLYPGGVTGLTILILRLCERFLAFQPPFAAVYLALNLVPVYIGFRCIGRRVTLYSCLMIVLTAVLTDLIPAFVITEDPLLLSVFGGLMSGFAVSICLNAGATSGGTDLISVSLSLKSGMDSFSLILGFNAAVLCAAGLFFGWDRALYSIIFQYAATAVLRLRYRRFQQCTLLIVTTRPREVCGAVYRATGHGATVLEGEGSYEHSERSVVYSVVSAAQSGQAMRAVREADPDAFFNEVRTQRLSGHFAIPPER